MAIPRNPLLLRLTAAVAVFAAALIAFMLLNRTSPSPSAAGSDAGSPAALVNASTDVRIANFQAAGPQPSEGLARLRLPRRRLPPEGAGDRRRELLHARAGRLRHGAAAEPARPGRADRHGRPCSGPPRLPRWPALRPRGPAAGAARGEALRRGGRRRGRARPLRARPGARSSAWSTSSPTSPHTRACPTSTSCTATSRAPPRRCRLAVSAGGGAAENVSYVQTLLGNLVLPGREARARARRIPAGALPLPRLRARQRRAGERRGRAP